ncbi:MAG: pitrilysin family protein [Desulfobacterales bacterium]
MDGPVVKTVLDNGVRLLAQPMAHARSVSLGVWVDVGARDESDAESGISHFIEHMIFKGTARRSAYQIAREFDAIGGQTNAFTSMEHTCYHARVLDRHLERMVDILTDIFLHSVFDPQEVERERPVILQEIGMMEDIPEDLIHVLAGRRFWDGHPLGRSILGSRETVSAVDSAAMRRFFRGRYRPERIVVAAAGRLEPDRLFDLVGPAFAGIACGEAFPERTPPHPRAQVTVQPRDLEQAHLLIAVEGLPVRDPRRYGLAILNTILGGNMSSRLFQEIRERRGLAYSVYSFVNAHADAGMFGVYLAVAPDSVPVALSCVASEMDRLCREPVEEAERAAAVEYLRGSLLLSAESTDAQMMRIAQNELHFGEELPLERVLEGIAAVSARELQELARGLFCREKTALTVLGPVRESPARLGALLAPLGG